MSTSKLAVLSRYTQNNICTLSKQVGGVESKETVQKQKWWKESSKSALQCINKFKSKKHKVRGMVIWFHIVSGLADLSERKHI